MAREFDELNEIGKSFKPRAIDYETYFGEMEISEEEKAERIKLAEKFEVLLLFYFLLYLEDKTKDYTEIIYTRYVDIANDFLQTNVTSAYLDDYARKYAQELQETTLKHDGEEWYTSADRAAYGAENESNSIGGYREQIRAVKAGKKFKQWQTMRDVRVRHSHVLADNQTVGIFDTFKVGDSEFGYPKDATYSPSAEEVINCRCVCRYF